MNIQVVDSIEQALLPTVNQLFAITLDLSALASGSDRLVQEQLIELVGDIDMAISSLRQDLFTM